jgi:peptidoglycan/xylan/chitin deacetylase (PgdA/CDA1 family)
MMTLLLPILTFHALDDQSSVLSFRPGVFKRGMVKLSKHGYRSISLLEAAGCLRSKKPFPDRCFIVTFDDGYESVYKEAFPVLQEHGLSATTFLTVGEPEVMNTAYRLPSLNGRRMLSWTEIREMKRWGMEFGAHTLTHPDLTCIPRKQMESEICDSKKMIEDALGTPVSSFAYPLGRYNNPVRDVVLEHFDCACSDHLGLMTATSDLFALERVDAYYLRTDRLFDVMLTKYFPYYIGALRIPRWIRRAVLNALR